MKKIISSENIDDVIIDESFISAIRWKKDDLIIELDWCGDEKLSKEFNYDIKSSVLFFNFVFSLKIDISFQALEMGEIFFKQFKAKKKSNDWKIEFNCSETPSGNISFRCYDFKFIIEG